MKVADLQAELERRMIPGFAYNIGRDENETFCLVPEPDGWHVFYSERGNRKLETVFVSESAACEELLRMVTNDGAVRRWMAEHGN